MMNAIKRRKTQRAGEPGVRDAECHFKLGGEGGPHRGSDLTIFLKKEPLLRNLGQGQGPT